MRAKEMFGELGWLDENKKNLKIFAKNIEQEAINQINELLEQEAFNSSKVRIMPDVHAGKGCVVGFTGNLKDKVIPNIVGVDIGCGMLCVELGNVDFDLKRLDKIIKQYVPSGMNVHEEKQTDHLGLKRLHCFKELNNKDDWLERSLGTLGGGNHFIEVDVDENGNKYLVIHTGSRNLGKQVAEIYQNKAIDYCSYKKEMQEEKQQIIKEYKKQGKQKEIQNKLIEINKKYEGKTKLPKDYLHDMNICQEFATFNRYVIASTIISNLFESDYTLVDSKKMKAEGTMFCFETIHNYISFEDNIVRKGAISARAGEIVLIPMNMRDGCIIGIGKGNDDWNRSAPHGAGRLMSRAKAKEIINLVEYKESMKGIYTTSVNEKTIDEAPMVYKPMQEIIDCIGETIEIEKIIKPIYNYKANE